MITYFKQLFGTLGFALSSFVVATLVAYLIKTTLLPAVEGRYVLLFGLYLAALLNNFIFVRIFKVTARNMVVFGGLLIVAVVFFLEVKIFARSSSIYQLYYSVGIIPLMYVVANFQLNSSKQQTLEPG